MPRREDTIERKNDRLIDLMERLGVIALYLSTDMGHHSIARRLGIGTQRVTRVLRGLKRRRV